MRRNPAWRFWLYCLLSVAFSMGTVFGWLVEDQVNIYVEAVLALAGVLISAGFMGLAFLTLVESYKGPEDGK